MGHTEQFCEKLFVVANDTGERGRNADLRAELPHAGNSTRNKWLKSDGSDNSSSAFQVVSKLHEEVNNPSQTESPPIITLVNYLVVTPNINDMVVANLQRVFRVLIPDHDMI